MRVVRFAGPDGPRLGVVDGDVVVDLSAVDPAAPRDLREVLLAGDVVVMGTPGGVGMARNPPLWMKHGDVVEVEIDGVGTLVNGVEDEVT
jgi:hypothetical protein